MWDFSPDGHPSWRPPTSGPSSPASTVLQLGQEPPSGFHPRGTADFQKTIDDDLVLLRGGDRGYFVDEQCLEMRFAEIESLQKELDNTHEAYRKFGDLNTKDAEGHITYLKETIKAKLQSTKDLASPWVPGRPRLGCT